MVFTRKDGDFPWYVSFREGTLQERNISYHGKRRISFKNVPLVGGYVSSLEDMTFHEITRFLFHFPTAGSVISTKSCLPCQCSDLIIQEYQYPSLSIQVCPTNPIVGMGLGPSILRFSEGVWIPRAYQTTLQGNNISHLGKSGKSSTQNAIFGGICDRSLEGSLNQTNQEPHPWCPIITQALPSINHSGRLNKFHEKWTFI